MGTGQRPYAARVTTLGKIRFWLGLFVVGLVVSGLTAFPLEWESGVLLHLPMPDFAAAWLTRVHTGLVETSDRYPFLSYGTDWLAFAHLVIATAFWGPLKDPVRNVWVVQFGMIACVAVVPLALVCGPLRGVPGWWLPIDIAFGAVGIVPLLLAYRQISRLAEQKHPMTA
jgi:hypothetical protein